MQKAQLLILGILYTVSVHANPCNEQHNTSKKEKAEQETETERERKLREYYEMLEKRYKITHQY